MYGLWALGLTLIILALLLVHYRPANTEGFAVAAVDPRRMPACVERSTDAQSLLARFATLPEEDAAAAELRLLVSKLCCLEADIVSPSAGQLRTLPLQFRTSHDMEPVSGLVSRCLKGAIRSRDVELVIEKFQTRGRELVRQVLGDCPDAAREMDAVLGRVRSAMQGVCVRASPSVGPSGPRDLGFWEPKGVADLDAYQGISAQP